MFVISLTLTESPCDIVLLIIIILNFVAHACYCITTNKVYLALHYFMGFEYHIWIAFPVVYFVYLGKTLIVLAFLPWSQSHASPPSTLNNTSSLPRVHLINPRNMGWFSRVHRQSITNRALWPLLVVVVEALVVRVVVALPEMCNVKIISFFGSNAVSWLAWL